ncbi:MAG: phosphate propanoyltransferase [Lachnospiraceae bacterium]|nr:phosphate propanoyltransferase [Lachnospiraceae bacterium]
MPPRIPIETSARHIHISKEHFEFLFGEGKELTFVKELSQPGQYVAAEKLAVIGPRGEFEKVSILGPFRKETQVEVSVTDTRKLGIPSVIRQSGDIEGTPGCTLRAGDKEIILDKGVIVAKRHIHMRPGDALQYNVKDNENVFVITKSYERNLIYADVVVRVSPQFRLAMHVDTDEANAFAGDADPYGVIVKIFDTESYSVDKWMEEVLRGINRI